MFRASNSSGPPPSAEMPGYELPDGKTLKNKVGATSSQELERAEGELVAARRIELAFGLGPAGRFDLDHLKAIHAHLFQDVYEWAGHTRDEKVALSDGTTAYEPTLRKAHGQLFATGSLVTAGLEDTFARLAEVGHLRGLDRDNFAVGAAAVLADINSAHPFREGNGRTQRAFLSALAQQAGHELRFDVVSRERMYQASIAAHERGDAGGFQRMLREIADPQRVAALAEAQSFLDRHRQSIDWRNVYMATTEEGQTYTLTMIGRAGPNFMARADGAILVGRTADLPDPPPANAERFTIRTAVRTMLATATPVLRELPAHASPAENGPDNHKPRGQRS